MRTPKSLLLLVVVGSLLLGTTASSLPSVAAGSEDWRPIEPADLALKAAVVEPNADAEAIFWDIRVDDGGQNDLVLSHYVRIKIFNERCREKYGKIDIPYFNGMKIKDVAARTIKPDGTIIELAKTDIIEKTVVKASGLKLRTKMFAFPAIEPGAIIEYKWKEVRSNSSANNMRLQFQREIPVQAVTYRIKPAKDMSWDVRPFNMDRFDFQREKNGFDVTTVNRMPAFREEPMMPPEDSVRSWALVRYHTIFSFLSGYTSQAAFAYEAFQPYMKVDKDIKAKATELVAAGATPDEKVLKIFEFCRDTIKNTDDKSAGFTDDQLEKMKENKKPSDTLKRGVGSGGDLNLLFAALVNAAGYEARVALLPNRGRALFDRNVQVPRALKAASIAVRS